MASTTGSRQQTWVTDEGRTGLFDRDRTYDHLLWSRSPVTEVSTPTTDASGALSLLANLGNNSKTPVTVPGTYHLDDGDTLVFNTPDPSYGYIDDFDSLGPTIVPTASYDAGASSPLLTSLAYGGAKAAANLMFPGVGGIGVDAVKAAASDNPTESLINSLGNTVINKLAFAANPLLGGALSVLSLTGMNPVQGIRSMFDSRDYGSLGGHEGGFFTKPSEYNGYTPGAAYYPGTNNLNDEQASQQRAFAQAEADRLSALAALQQQAEQQAAAQQAAQQVDEATQRTSSGAYTPEQQSVLNMIQQTTMDDDATYGGYASTNSHDSASGGYGYSNPASSYGSWSSSSNTSDSGGNKRGGLVKVKNGKRYRGR